MWLSYFTFNARQHTSNSIYLSSKVSQNRLNKRVDKKNSDTEILEASAFYANSRVSKPSPPDEDSVIIMC